MARELPERVRGVVRWETGLVLALAAVVVFGVQASSQFLTSANLFYLNLSIGEVAIMTLPMTLIIVTGEIDLSVASILGMSSALLGDLVTRGWSVPAAIFAVLVVGALAGWGWARGYEQEAALADLHQRMAVQEEEVRQLRTGLQRLGQHEWLEP